MRCLRCEGGGVRHQGYGVRHHNFFGSSEICDNESYPIEAIVMLHQAKENAIEPLHGLEPVKKLMAQVTINMWNSEYLMKAMDLIEGMAGEVPVFELGCDISEGAIECLERGC